MRRVKFKFIDIPTSFNMFLELGIEDEYEIIDKPDEIPESAVRNGLYYILNGKGSYIKCISKDGKWFRLGYASNLEASLEFNGYHRLLTNKELKSFNDLIKTLGARCLSKYWRNLVFIQMLNLDAIKDIRTNIKLPSFKFFREVDHEKSKI